MKDRSDEGFDDIVADLDREENRIQTAFAYRRGYVRYGTKFTIRSTSCHVCGTPYEYFNLGGAHIYATCRKCHRQDEVGLVFGG